MGSDVPQRQLVDPRKDERGSALIVAIMFMAVLFAITLAAAKVRVASAKDVEDQNAQQSAYWEARSGAATLQASLLTDVPAAFDRSEEHTSELQSQSNLVCRLLL